MTQLRIITLFLLFACFGTKSTSQSYFQKSYDIGFSEQIHAAILLNNGDFVLAGFTESVTNGNRNIWLMKLKPDGDTIWTKSLSLTQATEAVALQKTSDGNILLVYNVIGSVTTSGWMKISTDGNILWSKKAIGGSYLINVSPSAQSGYLLCGKSISSGNQETGLVIKIDESGNIAWSSVFGENGSSAVTDCWEDALGFIHCCGFTSVSGGNRDGFWAKLGGTGDLVSPVRRFGSTEPDEFASIVPLGQDKLLLCGHTFGFDNDAYSEAWAVEVDYFGGLKSSKTFALAETNLSTKDMIPSPGGQFLWALGLSQGQLSPAIVLKINEGMDQLFAYQYKGGSESDVFTQLVKTASGFAGAGNTLRNGNSNGYLVNMDIEGRLNDDDCCPVPLEIIRTDVTPTTSSFVPTQTAFYAVQANSFTVSSAAADVEDLCQRIDLDFSISVDTICPGECVEITHVDSVPGIQYRFEFQNGEEDPDMPGTICHTGNGAMFITLFGANHNCEKSYTKKVNIGSKYDAFPNAFTPNNDSANDVFRPVFNCPAVSMHLQVFDRWGNKVFETNDPKGGWDGKIKGTDAASDVYVWKLEYEAENNGVREQFFRSGEVSLLR